MNSIGYRVKLNDYLDTDTDYRQFLEEYFKLFNIMEVKLNKHLINHESADYYIKYLLDMYKDRVSFHFNKSLLDTGMNDIERMIINYLYKKDYKVNCITHLNDNFNSIKLIKEEFNENTLLTLENPEIDGDILSYLEGVSEIVHKLEEDNSKVNLCIDWGHILLNNRDVALVYNKLRREDLLRYIIEYHIHNIKNNKDHQSILDGEIDCNTIYRLIKNNGSRIILECEVNNINKDGLENIKLLTKK